MTIYIFAGPTLTPDEVSAELDAFVLSPAAQGDVYQAALGRPSAIGVIDGYFERIPSIWHKEILWAMAQGISVYGSASMGALRAAELHAFGMVGVGAIFEAFARGELEDDDEVAVAHASEDDGYRAVSEAMVNIRATLTSAAEHGVIGRATHDDLVRIAKSLFYPDRCYPLLLDRAREQGMGGAEIDALRGWLKHGQVNQKRADALSMLRRMRDDQATPKAPRRVDYHFEHTDAWEETRRAVGRRESRPAEEAEAPTAALDAVLEELSVSGAIDHARRGALARSLAIEAARQQGRVVADEVLRDTVEAFRRERGLLEPADFKRWLAEQDIDDGARFFTDEAQLRWIETVLEGEVVRALPDHLRATGEYGALLARAADKERRLAARGLEAPDLGDLGLTEDALFRWYFEERLGLPVPQDLAGYAERMGFDDEAALRRAVLRERIYLREVTLPDATSGTP